jgi:hydroxymethylpyrimidine pyrophosphatase-like HAD family hydrolase
LHCAGWLRGVGRAERQGHLTRRAWRLIVPRPRILTSTPLRVCEESAQGPLMHQRDMTESRSSDPPAEKGGSRPDQAAPPGAVERDPLAAQEWQALATDFDGTIATDGVIDEPTVEALRAFRARGRKLILVTGRELGDFARIKTPLKLFDLVVAENGAVLYNPLTGHERILASPPDEKLVDELRRRGVGPLSLGRVIVATWEPHEHTVLEVVKDLGVGYNVIFNKGAVMLLPAGVDKAVGLRAALAELNLEARRVIGVGDAENDHAFLQLCGLSVAVSNAIPALKKASDFVTTADRGRGVTELLHRIDGNN